MQLYNNNNSLVLACPKTLLEESREKLSIYDPYTFGKVILNFPTKLPLDSETRLLNSNSDFTFCHCRTLSEFTQLPCAPFLLYDWGHIISSTIMKIT